MDDDLEFAVYLEIDEGFPEHPKTLALCAALENPVGFGYVINFWRWACRSCKTGDLVGCSSYAIEEAAKYHKHDGKLFAALTARLGKRHGFIEVDENGDPTKIHNWVKRTGASIARMEADAERKREYRAGKSWEVLRLEILERDNYTCVRCGDRPEDSSRIEVHHKIPLRKFENKKAGNSPSNLESLCEKCHPLVEREYREEERSSTGRRADGDGTADTEQNSTDQNRRGPWLQGRSVRGPNASTVLSTFSRVRAEVCATTSLFYQPSRGALDKAASLLSGMDQKALEDIEPAIRLACEHVRDSAKGWTHESMKDPNFLWATIVSRWSMLREEIHGVAPEAKPTSRGTRAEASRRAIEDWRPPGHGKETGT